MSDAPSLSEKLQDRKALYPEGAILDHAKRLAYIRERSESPIEFRLAWTLLFSQKFVIVPSDKVEFRLSPFHFAFVMQHPAGRYRLDMAVFFHDTAGKFHKVALECDGKQFHTGHANEWRDKTRDGLLLREGFQVWRYPGWLLHHAAECAADEIHTALNEIVKGEAPTLTFCTNQQQEEVTLRHYESAYWAYEEGVPWPPHLGKSPKARGWTCIWDLYDWADGEFPELGDAA